MRISNKSAAVFAMAVCGMLAGCVEHSTVRYSEDAHNVVQVFHPGDTLDWEDGLPVKWVGDSPCEAADQKPCVIAKGTAGFLFKYTCADGTCDPEIAVDDPGVGARGRALRPIMKSTGRAGALPPTPPQNISLYCDAAGNLQTPDTSTTVGSRVAWGKLGTHVKDGWTVTIADDTLCDEGRAFDVTGICTIKAPASFPYKVKYTVANLCTATSTGNSTSTVTVYGQLLVNPKK